MNPEVSWPVHTSLCCHLFLDLLSAGSAGKPLSSWCPMRTMPNLSWGTGTLLDEGHLIKKRQSRTLQIHTTAWGKRILGAKPALNEDALHPPTRLPQDYQPRTLHVQTAMEMPCLLQSQSGLGNTDLERYSVKGTAISPRASRDRPGPRRTEEQQRDVSSGDLLPHFGFSCLCTSLVIQT